SPDTDRDEWERDHWRGRLSVEDQERFDNYYSRYLEYRRDDNRFEAENMERRMRGIMQVYETPPEVPYEQIAWRDRHSPGSTERPYWRLAWGDRHGLGSTESPSYLEAEGPPLELPLRRAQFEYF